MKLFLFLPLILVACGTDSGGGSSSAKIPPTLKNILVLIGTCNTDNDPGCKATAAIAISDPNYDKAAFGIVFTWSLTELPPECDATNSNEAPAGIFDIPQKVPFGSFVSAEACLFDRSSKKYTRADFGVAAAPESP